jgi:hypothetical protein
MIGTCHPQNRSIRSAVDAGRQAKDGPRLVVESSIPPATPAPQKASRRPA